MTTTTKRQNEILKAIGKGNFATCHLFDMINLRWKTIEKHVRKLESMGLIEVTMDNYTHDIPAMNFCLTREGRDKITPLKLK
tara:strand:- start:29542 stop:29787 length:246 start_codon:yes stop_codon:yes gene_type:complete